MKYEVKITPSAFKELVLILQRIVTNSFSPEIGRKWEMRFAEAVLSLNEFPRRYPLVSEEPWHSRRIHKMPIPPYVAYYCVSEERKTVNVNAFCHAKQNQSNVLKETYGI